MDIIPAIDLLDGKVVRLHKGSFDEVTVYNDSPLEEARTFEEAGFDLIHVVDLNGAREGTFRNLGHVSEILDHTGLSIQAGGGIRTIEDAQLLLNAGVARVVCSSMAVKKPGDWNRLLENFPQQAVLALDLKDGRVAYGGWEKTADESIASFLEPMIERGLKHVLSTDISRDGTLEGPNIPMYKKLMADFPTLRFIASGGVGSLEDLQLLREAGLPAAVVGRAYYEGKISLEEMAALTG